MLWLLFMRFMLISSLVAWWLKRPSSSLQTLLLCLASLITFWVVAPLYANLAFALSMHYSRELFWYLRLDALLHSHTNMIVTLAAVLWLLNRTWQTLWKPTTELISILGVDVPEPPDVALAGIRADAATLNWTRPSANRPVQKFLIQVNGVNVGESRSEETAITVTGLRPNHCYNVRVIAVGPNNFQTGSQIIRLRTYKQDGRPELGNSRIPDSFQDQDAKANQPQSSDGANTKSQVPSIEAAPSLDGVSASQREGSSSAPGQRRNTLNRRHSPSVTNQDQPAIKLPYNSDRPEPSLKELADALEKTRKEIDDILAQYAQEESDFKQLQASLKKEKEKKKQTHKEKDDQTAQLKQKVKATYEQMRQTNKEKARKENLFKEKQDKRRKMKDSVDKCNNDVGSMKKSREGFTSEKENLQQDRDLKLKHLEEENAELQEEYAQLEAEYKERKEQLNDLENERKQLPGGEDDDKWKEDDRRMRREFDMRRRELQSQLIMESRRAQQIENHIHVLHTQIYTQQQSGLQLYNQANSSGVDFEQNASTQVKRRSRNSNTSLPNQPVSSPPQQFSGTESIFGPAIGQGKSPFAPGPFMDMSAEPMSMGMGLGMSLGMGTSLNTDHGLSEAEMRALTGGAPLSPTATALLPSGILMDDDPPSPPSNPRRSPVDADQENDPQSPTSSDHMSFLSSPHNSTHHLPFALHHVDSGGERRSLHEITSSPGGPPAATSHRFTNLLASFNRSRGVRDLDDGGPIFGTLKPGQSQSFPRQTEEPDNKRKMSFTSSWFGRNVAPGPDMGESHVSQLSKFSARRLNPFASSSSIFPDRNPSSPRPASIASAELPRPSTDSGSIWGAPGEAVNFSKSRIWSPEGMQWSRNPSRRPSIHGSPSALKTTLASADDEILDDDDLLDPHTSPSQVGVIGSRPPAGRSRAQAQAQAQALAEAEEQAQSLGQRLNPNAPTFMAGLFQPKDKAKDKDRERKATTPSIEVPPPGLGLDDSPSDSRMSRDAFSVHTHTSASVTESRESLSLDTTYSNTGSDGNTNPASASIKDQESAMRKLFRKGSSGKFSLSGRLSKESGLFKKGPGSTTNSDKNMSAEQRSSIGDVDDLNEGDLGHLGRSYDSVTSSPSLGPSKSRDSKEGRISNWSSRFTIKKKPKESLDLDRDRPEETEGEEK